MYVLGLGGSNHDFSACLVKDGQVLFMVDDERITRKKHGIGLGVELAKGFARKYVLDAAGITLDEVDMVVGNDLLVKTLYHRLEDRIILINHHLAHAASSFYPSDFSESAILVIDAVGSKKEVDGRMQHESITFAFGQGKEIDMLQKQYGVNLPGTDFIENSIGIFYSIITDIAGFGEHEEGKTMGLAPYGTDRYYAEVSKYIRYQGGGQINMTAQDIAGLHSLKELVAAEKDPEKSFLVRADLAWAGQKILEDLIIQLAEHLYTLTGCKNLCIAGGVGLNSVANYKLYKEGIFKNIFIQPATADNGTSLGSALYGYHVLKGQTLATK